MPAAVAVKSRRDDTEIQREQRNKKSSKLCTGSHNLSAVETKNISSKYRYLTHSCSLESYGKKFTISLLHL